MLFAVKLICNLCMENENYFKKIVTFFMARGLGNYGAEAGI